MAIDILSLLRPGSRRWVWVFLNTIPWEYHFPCFEHRQRTTTAFVRRMTMTFHLLKPFCVWYRLRLCSCMTQFADRQPRAQSRPIAIQGTDIFKRQESNMQDLIVCNRTFHKSHVGKTLQLPNTSRIINFRRPLHSPQRDALAASIAHTKE